MLSSIPASVINRIRAVPPALKNGNETPVGGTEFVTTAILKRLWTAISAVMPEAIRHPYTSGAWTAILIPLQMNIRNSSITAIAPIKPSSSARIGKM